MSNGAGKFFGGVIVGTVIGATLGILFAPRSGKETRQVLKRSSKDLSKLAEEVSNNVQYQTDRLTVKAQRNIDEALIRLQEAIATGQDASRKLQDELILSMVNTSNNSSIEIDDIPVEDED
ncbi:MAG: YtxH domain-containing protein [Pseudanabaena sp.]